MNPVRWSKDKLRRSWRVSRHYGLRQLRQGKKLLRIVRKDPWQLLYLFVRFLKTTLTLRNARKLAKVALLAFAFVFVAVTSVVIVASFFISSADINDQLRGLVKEQSGGELVISHTDLNLFTGLTLKGVSFYPRSATSDRALVAIDQVVIGYDFLALFLGTVSLEQAEIIRPRLYLENMDGHWNFDPIIAHLAKANPAPPAPEPEEKKSNEPQRISDILPIHPSSIILPFRLALHRIGISNLGVTLVEQSAGGDRATTTVDGVTALAHIDWLFQRSTIALEIEGARSKRLKIVRTEQRAGPDRVPQELSAAIELSQRVVLSDLTRISIATDLLAKKVVTPGITLKDLPLNLRFGVSLLPALNGVKIEKSSIKALRALTHEMAGTIISPEGYLNALRVDIEQSAAIDLAGFAPIVSALGLDAKLGGMIRLAKLKIDGAVDTDQLSGEAIYQNVPNLATLIELAGVQIDWPSQGLAVAPFSGKLSAFTRPSLFGSGVNLEADGDMLLPLVTLQQKIDGRAHDLAVTNFAQSFTARVNFPEISVPFLKLGIEADEIASRIDGEAPLQLPLSLDVYGALAEQLEKAEMTAKVEVGSLLDLNVDVLCRMTCNQFKITHGLQVDDLGKLYSIVRPIASKLMPLNQLPEKIAGRVGVSAQIRGSIPNIRERDPKLIFDTTDADINLALNVNDLSAKVPLFKIELDKMSTRLELDGTLKEQTLNLRQAFRQLALELPNQKDPAAPLPLEVKQLSFDTTVTNKVDAWTDVAKIAQALTTGVESKLYVGQVLAKSILPNPMTGLTLDMALTQTALRQIDIAKIDFTAPDFGAMAHLDGSAAIDETFRPKSFATNAKLTVQQTGAGPLAAAIKASGGLGITVSASSSDMKQVRVEGRSRFDHFHLTIPAKEPSSPALLLVENINGLVPFEQTVDLDQLLAADAAPAGAEATPTKASSEESPVDEYFSRSHSKAVADANLINHVDFPAMKTFYPKHQTLSIERVAAANLELSNLEFDIEVKQNWFSLSQFSLAFLGGKVNGSFQTAFNPKPEAIKLALHVTRLNTHKLVQNFPKLRNKVRSWSLTSDPYIDSSVHLNYDIKHNDMIGGIDITTIGKEQLKMVLYYLDPEQQNPTLSAIRKSLVIGDVNKVSIPIKNGFIGLDVGVSVLAIPIPLPKLSRFPIAQLVANFQSSSEPSEENPAEAESVSVAH